MALLPMPLQINPAQNAKATRQAVLLSGMFVLGAAGFAVGTYSLGTDYLAERELWSTGTAGTVLEYGGKVDTRTVLFIPMMNTYKIEISFVDADGATHEGTAEFDYMFSSIDETVKPGLRYDPADPERFVLSFEAEGGLPRVGMTLVCIALTLLFVVAAWSTISGELKRRAATAAVAEDGEEVLAEIVDVDESDGQYKVTYRMPDDPASKTRKANLTVAPLTIGPGHDRVVTLRDRRNPDTILVMGADLAPFLVDPEVVSDIINRADSGAV